MTIHGARSRRVDLHRGYALARWEAWDNPAPATSQRRAMQSIGSLSTMFGGSNRSGKTEAVLRFPWLYALGGDHPIVAAFCNRNGLDRSEFPKGPGRAWVVALSSNDSIRYHRERVAAMVPESEWDEFRNRRGKGEAVLRVKVPGYSRRNRSPLNGLDVAEIWFKSCEQKEDGMQGDAVRCCVFDEEPDWSVWEEASMRVGREPLRMFLSCIWKKGRTPLYRRLVEESGPPERVVHFLHAMDNTALPIEVRDQLRRKFELLPESVRDVREFGRPAEAGGRVYPVFSRHLHVIAPFEIPAEWPRWRCMDWGYRNPTVFLWFALSPDDDLYVYREHRGAGKLAPWHARKVIELSGSEHYRLTHGDPSRPDVLADFAEHGVKIRGADNVVEPGILDVQARLEPDARGRPSIFFFDTVGGTIQEMETYRRHARTGRPIEEDDHGPDVVRYQCRAIKPRRGGLAGVALDSGDLAQNSYWRS